MDFETALAALLARALSSVGIGRTQSELCRVVARHPNISKAAEQDLNRLASSNPACPDHLCAFIAFRGFQALQSYRLTHALWAEGQVQFAVLLQNWFAIAYGVDIHPAAQIGNAIFLDHGIGVVIGETSVIEDNVNLWHGVTLGSTLTQPGDRHPKVRSGATICAGAAILGNIEIGAGAIVAASSVVLHSVPPKTIVAGIPAKIVGDAPACLAAIAALPNDMNKRNGVDHDPAK